MDWKVTATQNEEAWLDDYIRDVIAHEPPPLPPHDQKIGHVEAHWHQVGPGSAYVYTNPEIGTADDRRLVEAMVMEQLRPHGFKRAVYTFSWDHSDLRKQADWSDIESKARRLIQTGNVTLLRNGYNTVIGQVQGDHGNYRTEISRDDPNSQAISGSTCQCDWGQFQNLPRTRQWKRFQDRPCAHILATYWQAQATPLDEDRAPGSAGQPGQMAFPGMGGPTQAPGSMPMMQQSPYVSPQAWFQPPDGGFSGMMPGGPQEGAGGVSAPSPEDALPQFPMDPSLQPQVNPTSTPGGRPGPTPTDPIQYPGGTFSSWQFARVADVEAPQFVNGDRVELQHEDLGTLVGRSEVHGAGQSTTIPARQIGEVLGTHPSTGMVNVLYMGGPWDNNGPMEPYGATAWHFPSSLALRNDVKAPGPAIRRAR